MSNLACVAGARREKGRGIRARREKRARGTRGAGGGYYIRKSLDFPSYILMALQLAQRTSMITAFQTIFHKCTFHVYMISLPPPSPYNPPIENENAMFTSQRSLVCLQYRVKVSSQPPRNNNKARKCVKIPSRLFSKHKLTFYCLIRSFHARAKYKIVAEVGVSDVIAFTLRARTHALASLARSLYFQTHHIKNGCEQTFFVRRSPFP